MSDLARQASNDLHLFLWRSSSEEASAAFLSLRLRAERFFCSFEPGQQDASVFCVSLHSVIDEIRQALPQAGPHIFTALVEDCTIPAPLASFPQFSMWTEQGYDQLVAALRTIGPRRILSASGHPSSIAELLADEPRTVSLAKAAMLAVTAATTAMGFPFAGPLNVNPPPAIYSTFDPASSDTSLGRDALSGHPAAGVSTIAELVHGTRPVIAIILSEYVDPASSNFSLLVYQLAFLLGVSVAGSHLYNSFVRPKYRGADLPTRDQLDGLIRQIGDRPISITITFGERTPTQALDSVLRREVEQSLARAGCDVKRAPQAVRSIETAIRATAAALPKKEGGNQVVTWQEYERSDYAIEPIIDFPRIPAVKHVNPPGTTSIIRKGTTMFEQLRSFLVHGHDELSLLQLKDFLQSTLRMPEPIVLAQQPNAGRTIIEKFEECSANVDVVFVIITPDDVGGKPAADLLGRARQNVLFELGYFVGKFSRRSGRVILLYRDGTEIPSDLAGVTYINISQGVPAAGVNIQKELTSIVQRSATA